MKDIPGYEGLYAVTSCGKVWSYRRKRFLKPGLIGDGYEAVCLPNGVMEYVHRLVAITYIPNPNNLPVVNHKDENSRNNCVNNLEWCTMQYNIEYSLHQRVRCIETGKEFISITECAKQMNLPFQAFKSFMSLGRVRKNSFAGYHFERVGRPTPLNKKTKSRIRRIRKED